LRYGAIPTAGMEEDVDVAVRDGMIIVKQANRVRGKCDLRDLVSRIPSDYRPEEVDLGASSRREVW
jgi:antitoxin component of MazEF toxin-antitoxin module